MITPWQAWLKSLGQSTDTPSSPSHEAFAQAWQSLWKSQMHTAWQQEWQKAWSQWQTSAESMWQSPSSYWQAVAGIQSARARSIAEFWQQQPEHFARLFRCTSFPEWVESMSRYNNAMLSNALTLATITQAQRGHLMQEWQRQNRMPTPSQLVAMWQQGWQNLHTATAETTAQQAAAPAAATPTTAPRSAAPATPASTVSNTTSSASTSSGRSEPSGSARKATNQQPLFDDADKKPAAASTRDNVTPLTSSTANSVMRSSSGNTLASAAAATRRSVVARRASGTRRRTPR